MPDGLAFDGDDIEAARPVDDLAHHQVVACGVDQAALLDRADRLLGRAVAISPTGAHLHEHQGAVVVADQIDLATLAGVVRFEDA